MRVYSYTVDKDRSFAAVTPDGWLRRVIGVTGRDFPDGYGLFAAARQP